MAPGFVLWKLEQVEMADVPSASGCDRWIVHEALTAAGGRSTGEDKHLVDGNPRFRLGCQPGAMAEAGIFESFARAG